MSEEEKKMKGTYRKHRDPKYKVDESTRMASPLHNYNQIRLGILLRFPDTDFRHTTYLRDLHCAWEEMTPEERDHELKMFSGVQVDFGRGRGEEKAELKEHLRRIISGYRRPNPFLGREAWEEMRKHNDKLGF